MARQRSGGRLIPLGGGQERAREGTLTGQLGLFPAFARTQCANVADAALRHRTLTDPHASGRFRVNGTLANIPELRKAFSCKADNAMANPRPCRIW